MVISHHVADFHLARNRALQNRGVECKAAGFTCCVDGKNQACLGVVAVKDTAKGPIVHCSNQGGGVACMNLASAIACEKRRWSRK